MRVEFHCGKCGKLIRAPRASSGKQGKCPYCQQTVYVPTPPDEIEEIPLVPIDSEARTEVEELDEEARRLVASLGHSEGSEQDAESRAASAPSGAAGAVDVSHLVIRALLAMQESRLEDASQLIHRLRQHADVARAHVQGLMVDELPPAELEDCPPALYKGFLRKIIEQL